MLVHQAITKKEINAHFGTKQQEFLEFVLSHYLSDGVGELDSSKLTPLLRLKYHNSISDALKELGDPNNIKVAFEGFQKYLYAATV